MPREKAYATNAERQAAYRARHKDQQPPREATLAILGRSLHGVFEDAVEANQSVLPPELLGRRADETLRNLVRYIYLHTERGKADPLFAPCVSEGRKQNIPDEVVENDEREKITVPIRKNLSARDTEKVCNIDPAK